MWQWQPRSWGQCLLLKKVSTENSGDVAGQAARLTFNLSKSGACRRHEMLSEEARWANGIIYIALQYFKFSRNFSCVQKSINLGRSSPIIARKLNPFADPKHFPIWPLPRWMSKCDVSQSNCRVSLIHYTEPDKLNYMIFSI
jgi:hypothetical protein